MPAGRGRGAAPARGCAGAGEGAGEGEGVAAAAAALRVPAREDPPGLPRCALERAGGRSCRREEDGGAFPFLS